MITFDQNGVATRESQAYFEQKKLAIITNSQMTDSGKASALGDLYNQYGMQYGTFNRMKGASYAKDDEVQTNTVYSSGSDHSLSATAWGVLFFVVVFGLGFLDQWLASSYNIHIGYIKGVESLMSWIFSSH